WKPSAGSTRSTACPWGSSIPCLGRTRTRARIRRRGGKPRRGRASGARVGSRSLEPPGERLAGDALVGLQVLLTGLGDDVVRDRRRRGSPVPARPRGPVPHVLLVEAGLRAAGLILIGGPEA